jgi:pimeloyl-ACP methyl ester carboxylesterase
MILKIAKWLIVTVIVVFLGIVVVIGVGSSMSLDREYTHTKRTAELPFFSSESPDGILRIQANGYEFRARIAVPDGVRDAPTVILLHGFPVTSAMWIPLVGPLVNAGYRVVAFDQRGYSPGARPEDPTAYVVPNLVSDVIAIADVVGAERFHLIGHDWGSAVGWSTVIQHPERILSWTGISIAHPAAFGEALQNDPDQQARSSYFALFTAPYLPEALMTFNDLALLMNGYSAMTPEQQEEYHRVFSEPLALTSALNWYRQMGASLSNASNLDPTVHTPTLFIWGNNDPSAGRAAVEGQAKYIKGRYREIELNGGHWLITSHAAEIIPALVQHLGANP